MDGLGSDLECSYEFGEEAACRDECSPWSTVVLRARLLHLPPPLFPLPW